MHFDKFIINSPKTIPNLILNQSSFGGITFRSFYSEVNLIHKNAFGKAAKTLEYAYINGCVSQIIYETPINHEPPDYDIWKSLNSFDNIQEFDVCLNVTKIPTEAFINKQDKLKLISFRLYDNLRNSVIVRKNAFYNMDNLEQIHFYHKNIKFQDDAFAFRKQSNKILKIRLSHLDDGMFSTYSFENVQRPVSFEIIDQEYSVEIVPEIPFKKLLESRNNWIDFKTPINCFTCANKWLLHVNGQIIHSSCSHDEDLTLEDEKIRKYFRTECNITNNINYDPCHYEFDKVSLSLFILIVNILQFQDDQKFRKREKFK